MTRGEPRKVEMHVDKEDKYCESDRGGGILGRVVSIGGRGVGAGVGVEGERMFGDNLRITGLWRQKTMHDAWTARSRR